MPKQLTPGDIREKYLTLSLPQQLELMDMLKEDIAEIIKQKMEVLNLETRHKTAELRGMLVKVNGGIEKDSLLGRWVEKIIKARGN